MLTACQGAFVAAPIGGLLWGGVGFAVRVLCLWIIAKVKGHRFDAFDRPRPLEAADYVGRHDSPVDNERFTDGNVRSRRVHSSRSGILG